MAKQKNAALGKGVFIGALLLVFAVVFGGMWVFRNLGKSDRVVDAEDATRTLNKLYDRIDPEEV